MKTTAHFAAASVLAVSLALAAGCEGGSSKALIVASVVNDSCSQHTSADDCRANTGSDCTWIAIGASCPAGASCPSGVCVTPDPCGKLTDRAACQADDRCAWSSALALSSGAILCPAGQDCANDG